MRNTHWKHKIFGTRINVHSICFVASGLTTPRLRGNGEHNGSLKPHAKYFLSHSCCQLPERNDRTEGSIVGSTVETTVWFPTRHTTSIQVGTIQRCTKRYKSLSWYHCTRTQNILHSSCPSTAKTFFHSALILVLLKECLVTRASHKMTAMTLSSAGTVRHLDVWLREKPRAILSQDFCSNDVPKA